MLGGFEVARPQTLAEAVELLEAADDKARVLAGGTDLLVNMKQGFESPTLLVAVGHLEELRGVYQGDGGDGSHEGLWIGASERLGTLASNPLVGDLAPALATACSLVAHPQIRAMATIGGNLLLDTRCRFVNRSTFWRDALGGCLKAQGDVCHVVPSGQRCVASTCGDTIPALMVLDAVAVVVGPQGTREVPVEQLRDKDGARPLRLSAGEVVTGIRLPAAPARRRSAYLKWAVREAVDFPLASVGLVFDPSGEGAADQSIGHLAIAVGALGPRPKRVKGLQRFVGAELTPSVAAEVAAVVHKQCTPLANMLGASNGDSGAGHRRQVIRALVERQLTAWAG